MDCKLSKQRLSLSAVVVQVSSMDVCYLGLNVYRCRVVIEFLNSLTGNLAASKLDGHVQRSSC